MQLERLVADVTHRRFLGCDGKTFALAFVSSAENGHLIFVLKQFYQVFHVWGLAGSAHGDIANGDDWNIETLAFEDTDVKQDVTCFDTDTIKPTQRQ